MRLLISCCMCIGASCSRYDYRIEAFCDDSIRVRLGIGGVPINDDLPGALLPMPCKNSRIEPQQENGTAVVSGNLQAAATADGRVKFTRISDGKVLLVVGPPMVKNATTKKDAMQFYTIGLNMRSDANATGKPEHIFGLGQIEGTVGKGGCPGNGSNEYGLPLSRNGRVVDLAVSKFHVSIPFAVSSHGYGVLLNAPGTGNVSVSNGTGMVWTLNKQPSVDYWVTTTAASASASASTTSPLANIYHRYADATGHAPALPPYAAHFWQSRLRYRTQEEAVGVARQFGALNLSLGVFVIDFFNQKLDGDFRMNPQCYPNVSRMVSDIRAATGAELMVSFWPDVKPQSAAHDALAKAGCVNSKNYVDPSTPACRSLMWGQYVKPNYWDNGVRAFWLDSTDFMTTTQTQVGSESWVGRMWANWWVQMFSEGTRASGHQPLILTRGLWAGAQRYGVVLWSSDIWSTFEELRAQVVEGIHASLSGIPWWASDVGGFGCPTSPHADGSAYMRELMVRWYQFGALSPIFRTHGCRAGQAAMPPGVAPLQTDSPCAVGQGPMGSCGPNEIWSFNGNSTGASAESSGHRTQDILTKYVKFRNDVLASYVVELSANVTKYGVPTMRPMWFDFPDDDGAYSTAIETSQYMFGPKYLVAPVTTQGATTKSVYFPAGAKWRDWEDASVVYEGGKTASVQAPLEKLPLFIREEHGQ